jgi:MFS family permease
LQREVVERNIRYLVLEIFWAAIFTACVSFNAAYLIRLGGSNLMVSLLTSGAALVNVIVTIPFAMFLERRLDRKPWIMWSLALVRVGYIGLVIVPWLPEGWAAPSMVLLILLLNIPAALFNAGWLPMMADVVPLERRAQLFSARSITLGATMAVSTLALGSWLDLVAFPTNYQLMFAVGVITAGISQVYVMRLTVPDTPVVKATERAPLTPALIRTLALQQRPYTNMLINTLLFNIAAWMAIPLQPIYFVRVLGASDGWVGLWLGLVSAGTILGNLIWRRLIDRRGYAWVLTRSTVLTALYYFLIGMTSDLNVILVLAFLVGMVNPGVELSHFSTLLETCPPARRAMYLGVFTTVMNMGLFLAPLLVAPLTDLLGAAHLLLVLGGLRFLGALLFALNPVRIGEVQPAASH